MTAPAVCTVIANVALATELATPATRRTALSATAPAEVAVAVPANLSNRLSAPVAVAFACAAPAILRDDFSAPVAPPVTIVTPAQKTLTGAFSAKAM
jgi:hypothetical protein